RMAKDSEGKTWIAALDQLPYFDPKKDSFTWVTPGYFG
ncbi:MAG: hypothetical protein ACI9V1_003350, partial [Spirosomataceae bacterium]